MGYKLSRSIKKSKMAFIIAIAVWLTLAILLVAPLSVSIVETSVDGKINAPDLFDSIAENMTAIGSNLGKIFKSGYINTFGKGMLYDTGFVILILIIGILKSRPKNEYTDIEHGSSDWCTNKEAYKILNPDKGIILAEKYYLPVDKRGNVNVMIVGRIWCW